MQAPVRDQERAVLTVSKSLREYFQNVMQSSGLDGFIHAASTTNRPQILGHLHNFVMEQLHQDPPTAEGRCVAQGPLSELHPALTAVVMTIKTPGDGSCMFHAVSIAICGTTVLSTTLRVLSALYLASSQKRLQELGVEQAAMAAGVGGVVENVSYLPLTHIRLETVCNYCID